VAVTRRQRVADRISRGSVQIGWRIARWPWEQKAWRERAGRLAVQGFSGWAVWRLAEAFPVVPEAALAWWLIAAYRAADAEDDEAELEDVIEQRPEPSREQLRDTLLHTVRTLAAGGNGVHLDRVFIGWQRAGMADTTMTLSEFREFVEDCGIPVRSSLKVRGIVRIGVHLADLPDPSPTGGGPGTVVG
jgi:hypothetical protein